MINTWFTDIIRTANERPFNEAELTRIMAYYDTMPSRLQLNEELERLEPTLIKPLHAELAKRFPGRELYSRRFVQDLVESLRWLNQAVLVDDLRLLRRRWTTHLLDVLEATDTDPQEVRDAYEVLGKMLQAQLPRSAWEVLEPAFNSVLDALARKPIVTV